MSGEPQTALEALRVLVEEANREPNTHAWVSASADGDWLWADRVRVDGPVFGQAVTGPDRATWREVPEEDRLPEYAIRELLRLAGKLPREPRPEVRRIKLALQIAEEHPDPDRPDHSAAQASALRGVLREIFGEKVP